MRFFENGPSIPAHLLEQRALGNVIFFCGAGISRRAGLPDFGGLTTSLIQKLGAEKAQKALRAHESFDRIFNALIAEFGGQEIDSRIYEALKTPKRPQLENHRIVLDLSRNLMGIPQVVTTNFDLLFERVDRNIRRFVPPSLPDLSLGTPVQGIVYLHGRLAKADGQTRAGYIISSADFGRAYLAEGWAARFVRELRERYTIVLLGYSADDPPMRYLLEGLHSRGDAGYRSPIYAFAPGDLGDIEEEWRDRGVTPIAYASLDTDHSGLWDTLSAWAATSVDPAAWNRSILALATQHPSELKPHQRGQVANLISSKAGARLFADAKPSPPAEWLCVFDQNSRYAKPRKESFVDAAEEIDPLELFGLDDDPPRPPAEPNETQTVVGTNYLSWMYGDTSFPERTSLAGWSPEWSNQLPERLHHLARWFGRIASEPAATWWAAGYLSLNPNLAWFINRQLREKDGLPPQARKFWQLYLESTALPLMGDHDFRWYEFEEIVKHGGWTSFAFREFERAIQPKVAISRSPYGSPRPPVDNWDKASLGEFLDLKVRVLDRHGTNAIIPNEHLPIIIKLVRRSLIRAAELLNEIDTVWWQLPTLHPSEGPGEQFHGRKEQYFLWFVALFQKLISIDRSAARSEMNLWDRNDPYFFGKLTIFALMDPHLASGSEAARVLGAMGDRVFFDSYNRRELLFTLRARWGDLTVRERRAIERKIIRGEARPEGLGAADYRQRRAVYAASTLRWLELNGCALTPTTTSQLPRLKSADSRWTEEWARSADDSLGPKGGWIETVTELRGLDELPIDEIVNAANERTEDRFGELRNFRPFQGLVTTAPLKAVAALRREAKRGSYPTSYWENLCSEWPEGTSPRLRWLFAKSLAALPQNIVQDLRHYIPGWLKSHLKELFGGNRRAALNIFDTILAAYAVGSEQVTTSGIGATTVGGVVQERSEVSFSKAINSPIGKLTECLFSLQGKALKSRPLPQFLADRLTTLFAVSGDGGGHAVCMTTQRMGWFDYYYRDWSHAALVPLFSLGNPRSEAAWHGRASDQNGLSNATWRKLLPALLGLLSGKAAWKLDESAFRRQIQALVWLARKQRGESRIISFAQAKAVLVATDDRGRVETVSTLAHVVSEECSWTTFVKPFIESAWPRQLRYRSEATSRAFSRLIDGTGSDFADAVETILPFLRPVPHLDMLTYRLAKEGAVDERDLARSFPAATLALLDALIADDRPSMPYELPKVLDILAEADPTLRQTRPWRRLQDLTS